MPSRNRLAIEQFPELGIFCLAARGVFNIVLELGERGPVRKKGGASGGAHATVATKSGWNDWNSSIRSAVEAGMFHSIKVPYQFLAKVRSTNL